ncbi:hypothetical protein AGABI1DRAFT_81643 [Agaricus bisporus var. burnettii JB137-S8]|uniref:Cupin type-2 domain-containing protein n=2 Tax=Agaricus bisporus var. burnettii TaxID=192524 RepID=K5Y6T5_AGABU|nr:uncharacterized protein AGABI1DRAFT_81643 [Agaricus bisporus var. burnettii JB137-S8]EKM83910.1 hypothetical protein AGABI1DRAFT_81643 [Agaricus bisporus var. burnettii JB137-S8]KAF7784285.1 hypothetical protein Agabi119p4_450 [Agaricus bisporus var. burnettii]
MSSTQLPPLRRVVTAHDHQGLAVVDSDMLLESERMEVAPGVRAASIWLTTGGLPVDDNNNPEDGAKRPIEDTSNFGIVHPSGTNVRSTELGPGAFAPMHRTSSLDYNILVSGTLILITEDGTQTLLKNPGDTVIQKGTMHAWKNPSDTQPVRWITVLVAAKPATVNGEPLKPEIIAGEPKSL